MVLPVLGTVLTALDGGVLTITLNRPDVLNAVSVAMAADLNEAVRYAARGDQVRCVVLTGAGRGFCTGADLRDRPRGAGFSYRDALRSHYNPIILALRTMEKPVIASVNGVAAGAGCSMALAADLRIASDRASFIQSFARVGLIPDAGATFLLPRLLGMAKALELALTGEPVAADEALRLGLVNRVVPHDELPVVAMEIARRLAAGPTRAYCLTKRAFNAGLTASLEAALDYEAHLQEIAGRTADHREGVAAFLEKRAPRFEGR